MANFDLNNYETVDSRIKRFYAQYESGAIRTEIVDFTGEPGHTRWVVKASVYRDYLLAEPSGTGFAFENDGEGMANKTSALENCETSAIGRALANIGYSGDKRASREEMTKAKPPVAAVTPPLGWRDLLAEVGSLEALQALYDTEAHKWFTDEVKLAFKARKAQL